MQCNAKESTSFTGFLCKTSVKWLAVIIYTIILMLLSHTLEEYWHEILNLFIVDKMLHAAAYGVLTGLLLFAVGANRPLWHYLMIFLIISIVAAIDEYSQTYIGGAYCTFSDWLADAVGSLAVLANFLIRRHECG